ncbi:hypothetical protein Tco_0091158 [Tanacetum coccineum]
MWHIYHKLNALQASISRSHSSGIIVLIPLSTSNQHQLLLPDLDQIEDLDLKIMDINLQIAMTAKRLEVLQEDRTNAKIGWKNKMHGRKQCRGQEFKPVRTEKGALMTYDEGLNQLVHKGRTQAYEGLVPKRETNLFWILQDHPLKHMSIRTMVVSSYIFEWSQQESRRLSEKIATKKPSFTPISECQKALADGSWLKAMQEDTLSVSTLHNKNIAIIVVCFWPLPHLWESKVYQMDVTESFLYATIDEEVTSKTSHLNAVKRSSSITRANKLGIMVATVSRGLEGMYSGFWRQLVLTGKSFGDWQKKPLNLYMALAHIVLVVV